MTVCNSDPDCEREGEICVGDLCQVGRRDNAPVILGVDGDGISDAESGFTAHRIDTHLAISGEHLEGAEVRLTDDAKVVHTLDVCESSAERLLVAMPSNLAAGTPTLTVINQAGSCTAELPVLRGADGSPDTPEQIRDKLLSVDGASSGLDADTVDGIHSADLAPLAHHHDDRYLMLSNMSAAEANTLTNGGNADSLHSHNGAHVRYAASYTPNNSDVLVAVSWLEILSHAESHNIRVTNTTTSSVWVAHSHNHDTMSWTTLGAAESLDIPTPDFNTLDIYCKRSGFTTGDFLSFHGMSTSGWVTGIAISD